MALDFLVSKLNNNGVRYKLIQYNSFLPEWIGYNLYADNKEIECLPTGLISGKIPDKSAIISSLVSSRYFLETPHINFNPRCGKISKANFSFAPSVAICKKDLQKIVNAKNVSGSIDVRKVKTKTRQLLVGNQKNPTNIIFSHYDSVMKGAVDNASGTAIMLDTVMSDASVLQNNLFVFDGNEEVSFDKPIYWGRGYRNFEKKYKKILDTCKKIVVIDCVGVSKTITTNSKDIIKLAFPLKNSSLYGKKVTLVTSDYDNLMAVYHSDLDISPRIQNEYLLEAQGILIKLISNCK